LLVLFFSFSPFLFVCLKFLLGGTSQFTYGHRITARGVDNVAG